MPKSGRSVPSSHAGWRLHPVAFRGKLKIRNHGPKTHMLKSAQVHGAMPCYKKMIMNQMVTRTERGTHASANAAPAATAQATTNRQLASKKKAKVATKAPANEAQAKELGAKRKAKTNGSERR